MLTTRMSPKISVKPLATTKNSAASVIPFRLTTANTRQSSFALTSSHTPTATPTRRSAMRRLLHLAPRGVSRVSVSAGVAGAV
jgi:hypothetical protein